MADHDANAQRKRVREVVDTIELLRLKRRDHWRDGGHPDCKRFTQEELCDLAYGAYKNMALGRTLRIPSRADMLRIADYLECTIHQTNDLLLVAQYTPEVVELREDEQRAALVQAEILLHMLPLPAVITTRGFFLHQANQHYLALTQLPSVAALPLEHRTVMRVCFDPTHPLYHLYHRPTLEGAASLQSMMDIFRTQCNRLGREDWLQPHVQELHALPGFSDYWERALPPRATTLPAGASLTYSAVIDTPIQHLNIGVRMSAAPFPYIYIPVPHNEAAYAVYAQLGCQVTENRWEHALRLGATT